MYFKAEIHREKGTDRSQFLRGEVDKYTWLDLGSSFLPSELNAAFLLAQLEQAQAITEQRLTLWNYYHQALLAPEAKGQLRRPVIPKACQHNAHIYYIIVTSKALRERVITELKAAKILALSYYVPLHSSIAGRRFGRAHGDLCLTNSLSERIIRLPLWVGLTTHQQDKVVHELTRVLNQFMD